MASKDKVDFKPFLNTKHQEEHHNASEAEQEDEVYCGLASCRPEPLQCCATMGMFSFVYTFSGLVTSTLAIYINSQITTLERQFGFSSSVSGFILSCNDIGYLLTTLLMSYIARRTHIPRVLGVSTILFGVSGLICSIPYFVTKDSLHARGNTSSANHLLGGQMCKLGQTHENESLISSLCPDSRSETNSNTPESIRTMTIILLAVGMIFQGFGKSPRYPFIATYVDDNVEKTKTTFYLGIITGLSIFGPAIAFTLGGVFSKMYVTLEETTLTPEDPRWIGAWWLGFVVFGSAGLVVAIPLFFFPRRMRARDPVVERVEKRRRDNVRTDIKEMFKSVLRIATNPIYMCMVLGNCVTLFAISGMLAFLPKYIEVQFQVPAWKANMMLGVLNVMGAAGGTVAGGVLTSKLKLRPITCVILLACISMVSVILSATGFFLGCPQPDIVGSSSDTLLQDPFRNASSTCGSVCGCYDDYFPVCGEDGINYYSPCHAGCTGSTSEMYTGCSCIPGNGTAVTALCESGCTSMYPYVVIMFFAAFLATFGMMPGFNVTIRSVREEDKPLAIGMSAFLNTLLGWFPGPVAFGRMIDTTCSMWGSCGGSGACLLYDLVLLKIRYHIMFVVTRGTAVLLYISAMVVAKIKKRPFYIEDLKPGPQENQEFIVKRGTNGRIQNTTM